MDVAHVAQAVVQMARPPLDANIQPKMAAAVYAGGVGIVILPLAWNFIY